MSKSDESDLSRINLSDSNDEIQTKVRKAKTDNDPIDEKIFDSGSIRFEAQNLINILTSLNSSSTEETLKRYEGKSFADFKKDLAEVLVEKISPISKKINDFKKDKGHLLEILEDGKNKSKVVADNTVQEVKKIIGLN